MWLVKYSCIKSHLISAACFACLVLIFLYKHNIMEGEDVASEIFMY